MNTYRGVAHDWYENLAMRLRRDVVKRRRCRPSNVLSGETLESRWLLAANLVADIHLAPVGSQPEHLVDVNGTVFFSAKDDTHGMELWKSDGTSGGTVMVKDIYPGIGSSKPQGLTAVGDTLFFVAHDGSHGFELWKSDGTDSGTVFVKDIRPGTDSGMNPESLGACDVVFEIVEHQGVAFFAADDGLSGFEVWRSDGTAAGTQLTGDVNPGPFGSCPDQLTSVGDDLFFAADGVDGRELYATSTSDDARLVADISSGASSSAPDQLTNYQGILYFAADDGVAGRELWKSDATATVLVKDINPGFGGSFPTELVQSGSHLLFSADDGVQGAELWQSDAAENTTTAVRDIYPGVISSVPRELTDVDGQLFFTAFDPDSGDELWTSFMGKDALGMPRRFTQLVKDIYPGLRGTFPFSSTPGELTNVNGSLFFAAGDATTGRELWVSYLDDCQLPDPVRVTTRVRDINPGVAASDPTSLTAVGDAVYFVANDGTKELWTSSFAGPPPTCPGLVTSQLKDLNAGDTTGSNPSNLTGNATSNGVEVYFTADDGVRGRELWKTSRTTVGTLSTALVSDINSGPNGSNPSHLTYARDASTGQQTLFFSAFAPTVSNALWKLDNQGNPVPLAPNLNPQYLTEFNGTLFFAASAGNQTGLWKSDGTIDGTQLVKTFSAAPFQLTVAGGLLYFSADDGVNGWETWKSDGTTDGTQLLADLYTGPFGSFPRGFTAAGQNVFFAADDGFNGDELYRYHPTFGLRRIDINPGSASSFPDELTHVSGGLYAPSGVLYFSADDGIHGREVYGVDLSGGANPDGLLKDVKPGVESSFPTELTNVAGTLYFSADDGEHGQELWRTRWEVDPVTSVPFLVAEMVEDIHPGPRWSLPRNLTNVGGQLYFSANNGNDSDELWVSNGAPTGTFMLADINPGGGGSWLSNPLSVGNVLFVAADDGTHGAELWVATSDPLAGDVNLDGEVGFNDFLILSGNYGETNATRAQGDLDGDGIVGFSDFLQLSANFGRSQRSQALPPIESSYP